MLRLKTMLRNFRQPDTLPDADSFRTSWHLDEIPNVSPRNSPVLSQRSTPRISPRSTPKQRIIDHFSDRLFTRSTARRVSIYSSGGLPGVEVSHHKVGEFRQLTDSLNRPLPPLPAGVASAPDSPMLIGIGSVGFSHEGVKSHSFASCTPILARYKDGETGLYHANAAWPNDEGREKILSKEPTDIFIVTKSGEGVHSNRQSVHAVELAKQAPPDCNIHILQVQRNTLAVEFDGNGLKIYDMNTPPTPYPPSPEMDQTDTLANQG